MLEMFSACNGSHHQCHSFTVNIIYIVDNHVSPRRQEGTFPQSEVISQFKQGYYIQIIRVEVMQGILIYNIVGRGKIT